jgi:hypothetical protein
MSAEIHWCKSWQGRPIIPATECRHEGPDALTINQRLERTKRGQHVIAFDASVCMACGADSIGKLSLVDGLKACMDEHGWNREVGLRLHDLAEHHAETLRQACCPVWMWYAFGFDSRQIVDMLNAGTLKECPTTVADKP